MATSLLEVKGIGPATADTLAEHGIKSAEELAATKLGSVMAIPGFSEIRAGRVIAAAQEALRTAAETGSPALAKKKAAAKPAKKKPAQKEKKEKTKKAEKSKKDKKAKKEKKAKESKSDKVKKDKKDSKKKSDKNKKK